MCEQLVLQEQQLPFSEQIALSSQKAPFLSASQPEKLRARELQFASPDTKGNINFCSPCSLLGIVSRSLWHRVWSRAPHTAPGRPLGEGTNACLKVSFLLPGLGAPAHGDGRLARRAFPHPRQGHHTGCSQQLWDRDVPRALPCIAMCLQPLGASSQPTPHSTQRGAGPVPQCQRLLLRGEPG